MTRGKKILLGFSLFCACIALGIAGAVWYIFHKYSQDLPDHAQLQNYSPPVVSRVYADDGRLLEEFAEQKRVFIPINAMPPRVINAFLSAEDQNFYSHEGIDYFGVGRAIIKNLMDKARGRQRSPAGGSTITQQVAKNFLLTSEKTMERKVKEAILSFRIERAFSKEKILELYLNEIFLGNRSYGVAAASLNYFNKPLEELTNAEMAYLAALPKAPNNYHPTRNKAAAVARRNWVLSRMLDDGHISQADYDSGIKEPLEIRPRTEEDSVDAGFFGEDVRRWLIEKFNEKAVYTAGYAIKTSLNPELQALADKTLRSGLIAYDRARGWHGTMGKIQNAEWRQDIKNKLAKFTNSYTDVGWQLAVITALHTDSVAIYTQDGVEGSIAADQYKWAMRGKKNPLMEGDVVYVSLANKENALYKLEQAPKINGGVVVMDVHNGRVLAMSGGFSYSASQFNRASQALRQPGSTFKPFVYLAAMEKGYPPNALVMDGPIVIDQGYGLGIWKPENYTQKFYGLQPLRQGLEKSRNLMTIRIAQLVGMDAVADISRRFGLNDNLPRGFSSALGSVETTLLKMTTAYAMLANGGRKLTPSLIDRVQDKEGNTVYRFDERTCPNCQVLAWKKQTMPLLPPALVTQVTDAASAYQVTSMLEGVITSGTGKTILAVGKPLAGKTGTTNESRDVWFVGFSPDIAVGIYLGHDNPKSLGKEATGGSLVAPMFRDFMKVALAARPAVPFTPPASITLQPINTAGQLLSAGTLGAIMEAFKESQAASPRRIDIVSSNAISVSVGAPEDGSVETYAPVVLPDGDEENAAAREAPKTSPSSSSDTQPNVEPSGGLDGIY
jgi:penicillin-binding protein 1A